MVQRSPPGGHLRVGHRSPGIPSETASVLREELQPSTARADGVGAKPFPFPGAEARSLFRGSRGAPRSNLWGFRAVRRSASSGPHRKEA